MIKKVKTRQKNLAGRRQRKKPLRFMKKFRIKIGIMCLIETKVKNVFGRLIELFYKFVWRIKNVHRINVIKEDWDYLIILDACRYDYFKKYNKIPGKLNKKISKGSHTKEWLEKNFGNGQYDLVYISANPFVSLMGSYGFKCFDQFFKVEPVWDYGWDKETGTVPPRKVIEAAVRAKKQFPDKRMIIHFFQPHPPFIGKTKITKRELRIGNNKQKEETNSTIERQVKEGKIPISKIKKAYRDNLVLVLREVQELLRHLDGKIVITADHGECFGKWGIIFHPYNIHIKELLEVPWLEINKTVKESEKISKEIEEALTTLENL